MATEKSAAPPRPRPQPAARPRGDGMVQRSRKYLGEVMEQLKKTNWPSKQDLIAQTQVVLGVLVVIGVFIAVWDSLLALIFKGVLMALGVRI